MKVTNVKSVYYEIVKHKNEIKKIVDYVKKGDINGFTPPSALGYKIKRDRRFKPHIKNKGRNSLTLLTY